MSAEVRIGGATLVLDQEAIAELARQVAPYLAPVEEPWIRGADAAAEILGCPRKRIYNLVARRELEHRKDGSTLMFKRAWLEAVVEGGGA